MVQAQLGQAFQQKCEVKFACLKAVEPDSYVWWSYRRPGGVENNITALLEGHYQVKEEVSEDHTSKLVFLTIDKVSPEDLETVFTCTASKGDNVKSFNVSLHEAASKKVVPKTEIIISVSIFVVLIITGVLLYLFRVKIEYQLKFYLNKLPKPKEGQDFDVMVLPGADDTGGSVAAQIADHLRRILKEKHYKVFEAPPESRAEVEEIDASPRCVTVIFVVESTESPQEQHLGAVTEWGCNVVFIVPDSFQDCEWSKLSKEYTQIYSQIPDLFTVLRWPGRDGLQSTHKSRNFWWRLRGSLPKVAQEMGDPKDRKRNYLLASEECN